MGNMKSFSIPIFNDLFQKYPNVTDLVRIENFISEHILKQMRSYRFSQFDLNNALNLLEQIKFNEQEEMIGDDAVNIYYLAVSLYIKCFQSSESRIKLEEDRIYKNDQTSKINYKYLKDLRNKHIMHDVNGFFDVIFVAGINENNHVHKVEVLAGYVQETIFVNKNEIEAVKKSIIIALQWVAEQYEKLAKKIKADLQTKSYEELLENDVKKSEAIILPTKEEVGLVRGK